MSTYRIFKYPTYPSYEIRKWFAMDRGNKHAQYSVYYLNKSINPTQQPLTTLQDSQSIIQQHKDLRDFKARKEKYYKKLR